MSTFNFFANIPNLQTLCRNAYDNVTNRVDSYSSDCELCSNLNKILYKASNGIVTPNDERLTALQKIYSGRFPDVIEQQDIASFNQVYYDLLSDFMKNINN